MPRSGGSRSLEGRAGFAARGGGRGVEERFCLSFWRGAEGVEDGPGPRSGGSRSFDGRAGSAKGGGNGEAGDRRRFDLRRGVGFRVGGTGRVSEPETRAARGRAPSHGHAKNPCAGDRHLAHLCLTRLVSLLRFVQLWGSPTSWQIPR